MANRSCRDVLVLQKLITCNMWFGIVMLKHSTIDVHVQNDLMLHDLVSVSYLSLSSLLFWFNFEGDIHGCLILINGGYSVINLACR